MSRWIIAYDITDDLRRARAAAALLKAGVRLQQSVYEVSHGVAPLLDDVLPGIVDPVQDAVIATPACGRCADLQQHIGQSGPRMADHWWIA